MDELIWFGDTLMTHDPDTAGVYLLWKKHEHNHLHFAGFFDADTTGDELAAMIADINQQPLNPVQLAQCYAVQLTGATAK
ncbi:hypothetical protein [Lacticaseibacillus yichunensis]|uniref:Uncharacterized protein n=1 Tax=Lacticaseibacillus yichunensis TaxID=2486015 RepID=A0ABW4CK10_9LACO|nr:hypothetical protein [Lacticaseibacillus yichunensis]